ncbi:hypothetical protein UFOVP4_48 [uncultured Caudovirales phage]|uniref:PD-(D/E)XK nuclease superfamily n=1 Tax=uncultured Caudovirales phage TaxID=2100421 RepID=A0A6J5T8R7_9CAUD|nr:hypothetical protein UFOVP4_48 [uncultured Caudovirales phage]CAB4241245.1 hypothetical protein UFOVP64_12 [uncultured Caudovirales phage]CAB5078985.1 hypothetical protein UFOVP145_26 [uncultured Caudovirales phage]
MMDFTPSPHIQFSADFQAVIDAAMEAKQQAEPPRTYLGASRLGDECERKLAYEFHHTAKDEGSHFPGKTLRIFDMGHDGETRVAAYLRLAGFTLLTERPDGKQFGFAIGWDDEQQRYRISGHCDGVITATPVINGSGMFEVPSLWENKALGGKSWKDTVAKGVRKSKPVYYVQMQLYQAYLGLTGAPGLFTALNRDTGEIYAELVPFDAASAQVASDRGARVVSTLTPDEASKIARDQTDFRCKFCDFSSTCWQQPDVPVDAPAGAPGEWWGA